MALLEDGLKRSSDRMTIEGSPVKHASFHAPFFSITILRMFLLMQINNINKRLDLTDTPVAFRFAITQTAKDNEPIIKDGPTVQQRKVLVFSSSTDEHDTGNHQENALRTALLSGPDGCLRRPELVNSVEWVDEYEHINKPGMSVNSTSSSLHILFLFTTI